jgi:hypothetical protein
MAFWSKKTEGSETPDAFDRGAKIIRRADELCRDVIVALQKMAFWSKKTEGETPDAFDRGAEIIRQAGELRRDAAKKLTGFDVIVALQTALGGEVAAMALRRDPSFSPDQKLYVLDQILDGVCPGVRKAAYVAAKLPPPPQNAEGKELTNEEFNALTMRILNEATKNNTLFGDALTATAKATGLMISIFAEQPGVSAEELVKFSQSAVAEFARDALAYRRQNA